MAALAGTGVGLSRYPFLSGNSRCRRKNSPFLPRRAERPKTFVATANAADFIADLARHIDPILGVGVGLPCMVMECGDIIYRSTLPRQSGVTITAPGIGLALAAASYLWATPGVAPGFFDMFVLAFVERLFRPSYRKDDFLLGKKLGEGAFGVVYKVSLAKSDPLAPKSDLVLKKATEYGAVEIWMNERVRRACPNSCADFVYGFRESSVKGKGKGEYWLIWRFEGEDTLSDLMASKEFPYNVYDLTQLFSSVNLKSYSSLTKIQRIEWNNRGMSSAHAIFISIMSLYLVFFSDVFSDQLEGPIILRTSNISTFSLGVSAGYFLTDLGMIFWLYPCLGGLEYVLHHSISLCSIAYSMLTGEGQLYTYMILISESTTPGINMRWFLDTAGMKRSGAYLINGVVMFFAWLVARIFLFLYLFQHIYLHYDEVLQLQAFGYLLVLVVPSALFVMNMMWFLKIFKGLRKALAKKQ